MHLRAYLMAMGLATVLAAATFFLVLFQLDPGLTGALGFTLFYLSLLLTLVGVLSMVGFLARALTRRTEVLSRLAVIAFRQATLISALTVAALFLHGERLLSWWNALILVALVTMIEFLFLTGARRPGVIA